MLLQAVWDGNDKHVKELIDLGADVNVFTNPIWKMTPIYYAALLNRMSTMQILIEAEYADLDFPDSYENTPLHIAAAKGHTEIASLLVEVGANSRLKNSFGDTPLHNACKMGHSEIASILVKHFANGVNLGNNKGNTPLHLASKKGHDSIVSLLAEVGADGDLKNNKGMTANELTKEYAKKSAPGNCFTPEVTTSLGKSLKNFIWGNN
jgi:ankyrin repeat protein